MTLTRLSDSPDAAITAVALRVGLDQQVSFLKGKDAGGRIRSLSRYVRQIAVDDSYVRRIRSYVRRKDRVPDGNLSKRTQTARRSR